LRPKANANLGAPPFGYFCVVGGGGGVLCFNFEIKDDETGEIRRE
jgi:hypothetical protein